MKTRNKKINLLIAFLLLFFVLVKTVDASECGVVEKTDIKTKASNIRVTYVPQVIDNGDGTTRRVIDIKIYNVTSDVFLTIGTTGTQVTADKQILDYQKIGPDGSITLRVPSVTEMSEYQLEIYTNGIYCSGDVVRTIKLTVPKYNFYSQLEACDGISEFYLCQEYITFNIDKSTFYEQTAAYREKMENPETADLILNDNNVASHKIAIADNSRKKYVAVGLIIAGGVVATYIIIKKKKEKQNQNEIW